MRVRAWLGSSLAARSRARWMSVVGAWPAASVGDVAGASPVGVTRSPIDACRHSAPRRSRGVRRARSFARRVGWRRWRGAAGGRRPRLPGSSAPYDRSNRDRAGHRLGPGAAGGAGSGQRRGDLVCRVSRRCLGGRRARGGRDRARAGAGVQAAARAPAPRRAGAPRSARAARSGHARSGAGGAGDRDHVVDRRPGRGRGLHGAVLAWGARRGVGGRGARSRAGARQAPARPRSH